MVDVCAGAADDLPAALPHGQAQVHILVPVAIGLFEAAAIFEQRSVDEETRPGDGLIFALLVYLRQGRVQMGVQMFGPGLVREDNARVVDRVRVRKELLDADDADGRV